MSHCLSGNGHKPCSWQSQCVFLENDKWMNIIHLNELTMKIMAHRTSRETRMTKLGNKAQMSVCSKPNPNHCITWWASNFPLHVSIFYSIVFTLSNISYLHCQMFRNPYEWFSSKKHYALENAYGIYNIFWVVNASINQVGVPRVGKIRKFYKDLVRSVSHDDLFMNW